MGFERIVTEEQRQRGTRKRQDRVKLKNAVDKIATSAGLTTPEKRALKAALTDQET